MRWVDALKVYNKGDKFCIPKKGTPAYDKVKAIMDKGKQNERAAYRKKGLKMAMELEKQKLGERKEKQKQQKRRDKKEKIEEERERMFLEKEELKRQKKEQSLIETQKFNELIKDRHPAIQAVMRAERRRRR